MITIPNNRDDVKNILLGQIGLIKQESNDHHEHLAELSIALCELCKEVVNWLPEDSLSESQRKQFGN